MIAEPTIICPCCSTEIKLTESLAAPLVHAVRKEYEDKIAQKEASVAKREADIRLQLEAVKDTRKAIDDQVARQLKVERVAVVAQETKKAKQAAALDLETKTSEISDLQAILKQRDERLKEAQQAQAELLRKQRELDDAKRAFELTVEKRVQAVIENVRARAKQEVDEGLKLKVTEKETQISSMQKQIEDLKRKADQGSQQLQGEALEIQLETLLSTKFPLDNIAPVSKGEFGGDVLHNVVGPMGQACGAILWESKQTKKWSIGWLSKLRNDQRAAKAEIAILVSYTIPKTIDSFGYIDGVWVTHPRYALQLVIALRQSLIEVENMRKAQDGQESKMELVYQYLTGPKFRLKFLSWDGKFIH